MLSERVRACERACVADGWSGCLARGALPSAGEPLHVSTFVVQTQIYFSTLPFFFFAVVLLLFDSSSTLPSFSLPLSPVSPPCQQCLFEIGIWANGSKMP